MEVHVMLGELAGSPPEQERARTSRRIRWPSFLAAATLLGLIVVLLRYAWLGAHSGLPEVAGCHLSSRGDDGLWEVDLDANLTRDAFALVEEVRRLPTSDRPLKFLEDVVVEFTPHNEKDADRPLTIVAYDFYMGAPFASVGIREFGESRWTSHVPNAKFLSRLRVFVARALVPAKAAEWARWEPNPQARDDSPHVAVPDDAPVDLRDAIQKTYSRDSAQRAKAAFELGRRPEDAVRALPELVRLLGEDFNQILEPYSTSPRDEALAAIMVSGDRGFEAVKRAFGSHDHGDRPYLAFVLVWSGHNKAVEPLISGLPDPDHRVRASAAKALRLVPDARAVEPLILALKDESIPVRIAATDALGRIGDSRGVRALLRMLTDPNAEIRAAVASALGESHSSEAVVPLIGALSDRNYEVCIQVAIALGKTSDRRAVEPLIALLSPGADKGRDKWWQVKRYAIEALGYLRDPRAVEPLIALISAPHDEHQTLLSVTAIEALGRIRGARSLDAIVTVLKTKRGTDIESVGDPVRSAAAKALGEFSDPAAVEALRSTLREDDRGIVGHEVRGALLRLGQFTDQRKE